MADMSTGPRSAKGREATLADGSEVYHQYLSADEVDQVRQSLKSGSL
jgi:hypothetical protein